MRRAAPSAAHRSPRVIDRNPWNDERSPPLLREPADAPQEDVGLRCQAEAVGRRHHQLPSGPQHAFSLSRDQSRVGDVFASSPTMLAMDSSATGRASPQAAAAIGTPPCSLTSRPATTIHSSAISTPTAGWPLRAAAASNCPGPQPRSSSIPSGLVYSASHPPSALARRSGALNTWPERISTKSRCTASRWANTLRTSVAASDVAASSSSATTRRRAWSRNYRHGGTCPRALVDGFCNRQGAVAV